MENIILINASSNQSLGKFYYKVRFLVSLSIFNFFILWYSTKIENIVTSAKEN